LAGRRAVDRMRFRGWHDKAVTLLKRMIADAPEEGSLLRLMGVQMLLLGRDKAAAEMFKAALLADPKDGEAAVHLGFVLKNGKEESLRDLPKAVELLKQVKVELPSCLSWPPFKGIEANEEGVEAKFWYHLGEGLQRLGQHEEAEGVHK